MVHSCSLHEQILEKLICGNQRKNLKIFSKYITGPEQFLFASVNIDNV